MAKAWREYDQATLDAAYDQSRWCAEMEAYRARYRADTEAARAALRPEAVSYGPHAMDLYAARGTPRGLHLHLHGGAWKANTRADAGFVAPAWVAAGFDVAVPDFSLLPTARLPQVVAEVEDCLRCLAPRGPVHLSGHSSGAHLAAVLAARFRLASVTLVSGIYDLEPVLRSARGGYVKLTPEEATALSPIRRAARITAPLTLAWGTAESPEFIRQGEEMAAATGARRLVLDGTHHFAAAYALCAGPLFEAMLERG